MAYTIYSNKLNYEESRNRGLALIQNLKEACLLEIDETVHGEMTVKMHDVVRDVAIWISSNYLEDGCKFLVRAGLGLTQLSQVKFSSDVKRISLMNNQIDRLPCEDASLIECSNASTLFLQHNDSLVKIPDGFLLRFQAIKVLSLGETNINSLPPSIMQLTNLETLILRYCQRMEELPTGWQGIGRLQILDLAYTAIRELPSEMARLIKLRELDLFCTGRLKSIPAGLCSMLASLEILNVERSGYVWSTKGAVEDGEAYLEELESLDTLRELFIQVKPKSSLTWMINPIWIERLTRFTLCIGVMPRDVYYLVRNKEIIMNGINFTEERTEYLLRTTNASFLMCYRCVGLEKLVSTKDCFSAIKWLSIGHDSINLRDTLGGGCGAKHDLLPNLEYLSLGEVSMRSISELVHHFGLALSKLEVLSVSKCCEMKYLFYVGHHLVLKSLKRIVIRDCTKLEELFECAPHQDIIASNLKEVHLCRLPEFSTARENNKAVPWSGLEIITVVGCDKMRKLPISGTNNSLKKITGEESWWSNLEWDDLDTKTSLQHLFQIYTS